MGQECCATLCFEDGTLSSFTFLLPTQEATGYEPNCSFINCPNYLATACHPALANCIGLVYGHRPLPVSGARTRTHLSTHFSFSVIGSELYWDSCYSLPICFCSCSMPNFATIVIVTLVFPSSVLPSLRGRRVSAQTGVHGLAGVSGESHLTRKQKRMKMCLYRFHCYY